MVGLPVAVVGGAGPVGPGAVADVLLDALDEVRHLPQDGPVGALVGVAGPEMDPRRRARTVPGV
ncbi:hypothetical protein GCM10009736_02480 [Actinomadura bangladeshensis]